MKAWLITWDWTGDHAAVNDPVVAVFSARTGEEAVRRYVEQRYIEKFASLDEKLSYARYNQLQELPCPGILERGRIHCGHNPHLSARLVDDLRVEKDSNGIGVLKWKEFPPVKAAKV